MKGEGKTDGTKYTYQWRRQGVRALLLNRRYRRSERDYGECWLIHLDFSMTHGGRLTDSGYRPGSRNISPSSILISLNSFPSTTLRSMPPLCW